MAQKTLKINIFPVFSLRIREFGTKTNSILLTKLHTPPVFLLKSPTSLLLTCSNTSALPRRYAQYTSQVRA